MQFHSIQEYPNAKLNYAVIVARHQGRWVLVRHRDRNTWEIPGGRREIGESVTEAAHRELREETGAQDFTLVPLEVYEIPARGAGLLCYAEIHSLGELGPSEIGERAFFADLPAELTHAEAHPKLFARARERMHLLEHLDAYEHIIWDWNGTLLDDIDHVLQVTNRLLVKYQLAPVDRARYQKLFRFPIREYYELLGYDLKTLDFAVLCDEFMAEYNRDHGTQSKLFPFVREKLRLIAGSKRQSILSAAAQTDLDGMMLHHGLADHFHAVFGIADNQAGSKLARGRELIAASQIAPEKTLLIGDTDHDYEVGKALGVDVLLVADGHQSFERLSAIHSNVLRSRLKNLS